MKRTFNRWLLRYCCELTGLQTTSLKKFCKAISSNSPHAAEAVFLYALDTGKENTGLLFISSETIKEQWQEMLILAKRHSGRAEAFLRDKSGTLNPRLQSVLDAYDAVDARHENGLCAKKQIAQVVSQLLESAGVSRYRLCKDLNLNEGNVYAWLAGDPTKVSRATARKVWEYAETLAVS